MKNTWLIYGRCLKSLEFAVFNFLVSTSKNHPKQKSTHAVTTNIFALDTDGPATGFDAWPGAGGGLRWLAAHRDLGCTLYRYFVEHCAAAAVDAALLAPPFRQNCYCLGAGVFAAFCPHFWPNRCRCRAGSCIAGGIHSFYYFADCAFYRFGRHLHPGQSAWQPGAKHRYFGDWHGAGKLHGHHRRFDAADSPFDSRQ